MDTIRAMELFKEYLCDDNFNFESDLYSEVINELAKWVLTPRNVVTLAVLVRMIKSNWARGNYYRHTINVSKFAKKCASLLVKSIEH